MKVLVTGSAGFIGARVCELLLDRGDAVCGLDSLNAYYEVELKKNSPQQVRVVQRLKIGRAHV